MSSCYPENISYFLGLKLLDKKNRMDPEAFGVKRPKFYLVILTDINIPGFYSSRIL